MNPGDDPQLYNRLIEKGAKYFPGIGHYEGHVHMGGGGLQLSGGRTGTNNLQTPGSGRPTCEGATIAAKDFGGGGSVYEGN